MDGIQPYAGAHRPAMPAQQHAPGFGFGFGPPQHVAHSPAQDAPVKTPSDYLRALKRKSWLVLTIGVLVSVAGAALVLRMPAVYRTQAEITIQYPEYDGILGHIIAKGSEITKPSAEEIERYVPDKLAMMRSKALIDFVLRDPTVNGGQPINPLDDQSTELAKNLFTRNVPGTHYFSVWLEGADPGKITRTLDVWLNEFRKKAQNDSQDLIQNSKLHAHKTISQLNDDLGKLHTEIYKIAQTSTAIAPGGTSLPKEKLALLNQTLAMERSRYKDLQRQVHLDSMRPAPVDTRGENIRSRIAAYNEELDYRLKRYKHAKGNSRSGDDMYLQVLRNEINDYKAKIARLQSLQPAEVQQTDDGEVILAAAREEISTLENESKQLLDQMQKSMPEYDRFLDLISQRENKQRILADTMQALANFEAISKTKDEPVKITVPPLEPIMPERPKRGLYIAGFIVFGFMLGSGLALFTEHLDKSVKVPEHLTGGLHLPLLGVVPRMKRTSRLHRGGHLWTPGVPDSIEADAYRNIRASLLGVAGSHGPIVTVLVTSAKAGEGKSTTALNLAATCARAGERTLLVDVDLRRPSLANVFPHSDGHLGLVDVLRGELPWQRVVVASDLPNLDFIPTGDTRDVPIEILGSLELKQLLLSLSQHHYDRVILDGPAVLGLADCRMLGRIVDTSLLVVRSGMMELRPLRRAKAMLEQSQVKLAGIVFNGLCDDLDNWSSYGPTPVQVELTPSEARALEAQTT